MEPPAAETGAMLWRRLDAPGHDACRLERRAAGWQLRGAAALRLGAEAAGFGYFVACDSAWRTIGAHVSGFIGQRPVRLSIRRHGACWRLNGAILPALQRLLDIDLGFSPSTNLLHLRRLALTVGAAAELTVAWLDVEAGTLSELPQRYERRGETTYWYESPSIGYAALLEVAPDGFVRSYPGLWESVSLP